MSFLAPHLRAYLEFKQKLGFTSFSRTVIARDLDYYVLFHGIHSFERLDESLVVHWMHAIPSLSSGTKNSKLSFARGFFQYLHRIGVLPDNPARRIPYLKHKPYQPYLYTLKEIQAILEGARKYQRKYPRLLLGWTLETMFFLIYACGLRLREALNLKIQDLDFEENTLALWETKFHKERLVPFSKMAAQKLKSYLALRQKYHPPESPRDSFFCSPAGKKYHSCTIEYHFRHILVRCGMAKPKGRGAPRIHDLRHTFAVHRLYKWYQDGVDPLNKLPLLSTYMGHVNIEATQVYLTITQALLREGDRRFQNIFEGLTQKAVARALKNL